jgi:hypothetical protein
MGDVEIALLRIGVHMGFGDVGKARLAHEAGERLLGRLGRGSLDLLVHVLRTWRQAANVERQPPRRPVFARRLIGQARIDQRVSHGFAQIARSLALHASGNFLGAEFNKQVGHGMS